MKKSKGVKVTVYNECAKRVNLQEKTQEQWSGAARYIRRGFSEKMGVSVPGYGYLGGD